MARIVQYPGLMEPINTTGGAPPEIITADKWLGEYPDFVSKIKKQAHTYPHFFNDDKHTGDPENFRDINYYHSYPDKVFGIKKQQHTFPDFSPIDPSHLGDAESFQDINYYQSFPDKIFGIKKQQHTYPAWEGLEEEPVEESSIDSWQPHTPTLVFDKQRLQYSHPPFAIDMAHIGDVETITPDKWSSPMSVIFSAKARQQFIYPSLALLELPPSAEAAVMPVTANYADLIFDKQRWQHGYPSSFFVASKPQILTALPQTAIINYPKAVRQYLYPSLFIDAESQTKPEAIQLDKWRGYYPDIIFDKPRKQYIYPHLFTDITDLILLSKWLGQQPPVHRDKKRLQYTHPAWFGQEEEPTEEVSIDSWMPHTLPLVWDKPRKQYLYSSLFTDSTRLIDAEAVSIDRLVGQHPDIIFDKRRQQHTYPEYLASLVVEFPPVSLDQWIGSYPNIIDNKKRLQHLFPNLFTEFRQPKAPFDSWKPIIPVLIWDKNRRRVVYPYLFYYDGVIIMPKIPLTSWEKTGTGTADWSSIDVSSSDWEKTTPTTSGWSESAKDSNSGWADTSKEKTDWEDP
ncbi:MAG: hypothetical protein QXW38_08400 [Candidatus Nitrosotenuis sp.]